MQYEAICTDDIIFLPKKYLVLQNSIYTYNNNLYFGKAGIELSDRAID